MTDAKETGRELEKERDGQKIPGGGMCDFQTLPVHSK